LTPSQIRNRLLVSRYLAEDYYDLVDVDSFGSESAHLPAAIDAVRYAGPSGGLLFLTSTDGMSSAGRRPERSLAAYGAHLRALPFSNEMGLRMLIGAAVSAAAAKGVALEPLFSYYSFHGPVFRVMLRATRSAAWPVRHYGFVSHCHAHGETRRLGWRDLGEASCPVCDREARPRALSVSGPIWTGPLHERDFVERMASEAAARGWSGHAVALDSPYRAKNSKTNRSVGGWVGGSPPQPFPLFGAASFGALAGAL
jgi:tRNA (guanine26-N2/guanine27-N2)-dimethyltransferase